jgi:hypothetical protein
MYFFFCMNCFAHEFVDLFCTCSQLLLKYITNNHNHHNSLDNLPHQHRRRLATEPGLGHTSPIMTSPSRSPPVVSPDQQQDNCFVDTPVAPRSPRSHGMAHSIHHRFSTTMKINCLCNLCEKPMFLGYKCKECKYRCHRGINTLISYQSSNI